MVDDNILTPNDRSAPHAHKTTPAGLSDFILSLIQALLRTGYYTPEHPESKKAKQGLYAMFQAIGLLKKEITFIVCETAEKKQIFLEGTASKSLNLERFMPLGMAELYNEKLMLFLERKELISLTLKQKMQSIEFHDFLDIMSQPILTDIQDQRKRDQFLCCLQDKGIKNISFVFNADLIRVERRIPWRAWIAISRLKKDITLIPILRNLEQEDLKQVKEEVVSDVMRPLGDAKLSLLTLVNTDLIDSKVMAEEEIEKNIIGTLSKTMVLATAEEFINSYSYLQKLVNQNAYEQKLKRILHEFKVRLKGMDEVESEPLLEKFYEKGMMTFDELTPKLKEKFTLQRFLRTFLENPDALLRRLDQIEDQDRYGSILKSVAAIIPSLVEQNRYDELTSILVILRRHEMEDNAISGRAAAMLEKLGASDIALTLKSKFMSEKKDSRLALYPIFLNLPRHMATHLMTIIEETDDKWVRKNAIELLLRMEPTGPDYLEEALKTDRLEEGVLRDVIKNLGTAQNRRLKHKMASVVAEYRGHSNPEIRKTVLMLISEAQASNREALLLTALEDPDLEVKRTAIKYLGIMKSKNAFAAFVEMLNNTTKSVSHDKEHIDIENHIYWALGYMNDLVADDGQTAEELLLGILAERGERDIISKLFRKGTNRLSEEAVCIICESLERIGTETSVSVLTELAKNKNRPWAGRAQKALETITGRDLTLPAIQPGSSDTAHESVKDPAV